MKRRIVCTIVTAMVILTFTCLLAFRTETVRVSAVSEPSGREKFQTLTQAGIQRNREMQKEQSSRPPDPSITDDVALGLMLRFISGNQNVQQKAQVRQYMTEILGVRNRADQDKLFAVGESYRSQSNQIQMRSEATTLKYHPAHSTLSEQDRRVLRQLGENKKNAVRNAKATLRQELSAEAWASVETALATRIKPRVKVSYHE